MIQRILDEEGVPRELIYLAQIESGFYPRAFSYKRAAGMWQFVQFRGQEYGLNQTGSTDERFDPEKATRAAARHLRDLYQHFGDWYLAMAAYNCGPGCVDKAIEHTGYADYWELSRLNALPRDTINYVPVILAITIIQKNPKDYGLEDIDADPPIEYDTVELHCPTNIALIADAADRPVSEIQDLNPALVRPVAPAGYQLHVPVGAAVAVMAALENVPEPHRENWRMHRVLSGETLAEIARQYATPASAIAQVNDRLVEGPEAGDLLIIPAASRPQPSSRLSMRTASRPAAARGSRSASRASGHAVSGNALHHRASTRPVKTAALTASRHSAAN
jgi:membrane-bound lytic murein transglycosylase D